MLAREDCKAFGVCFGEDSSIGVFKAPGFLSVGVCIGGRDLCREEAILGIFKSHGVEMLQSTPRIAIRRKTQRVFLIRFKRNSQFLSSMSDLEKLNKAGVPLIIKRTKPTMIWQKLPR
jgi:hypothetical protein